MAMKESLSGISSELGKILQQLRDIESVQDRIGKSAGTYSRALAGAGAGGGGSIGGSGFSTPPPAPGSQAGGITPTASGAAGGAPAGGQQGGSGLGGGIAAAAGAMVTAGFNFLPSTQDSVAYQSAFFRSSFMGQGGYKQDDLAKMRAMFGDRQTDPFGMVTAANAATMSGMGMGTAHFGTVMRQTATTSMLFGQSNALAAQAQTSLYSGPTAGRLGNIGIFVSDLNSGDPRAFGDIIDQIWQRAYGSKNAEIPYESVMADLRGGYLGAWLRRNFGDNPGLYDQLYQAIVLKANSNGKTLDYSDLKGKGIGSMMSTAKGQTSAMGSGMNLGLNEENDPMYFAARGYGAQARAVEGAMSEMVTAWRNSMNPLINATEAYADTMEDGNNTLMNIVTSLKGYLQTLGGNQVTNPLLGGFLGFLGGGISSFFRAKGGEGTSTSDSILARLSKGEYVINARAAQMIGDQNLDALNAMGHAFGSAYASPVRSFDKGGSTKDNKPSGSVSSDDVLKLARTKLGAPYVAGADGPDKFDCSGFTEWVYETNFGIPLGEVSYVQVNEHQLVAKAKSTSDKVDISLAKPGDLLFFDTDAHEADPSGLGISHVGIYAGGNKMIHAWGPPLAETDLANYSSPLRAITRLPLSDASPVSTSSSEGTPPASSGGVGEPAASPLRALASMMFGQGTSVSGFSSYSGGASSLGFSLSSVSWHNALGPKNMLLAPSGVGTRSKDATSTTGATSSTSSHPDPGTGSGEKWLYDFLASKGLRGDKLRVAWTIAMRESGGRPSLVAAGSAGSWTYPDVPGWINWNSSESPKYDTGIFQINNVHLSKVKSAFGSGAGMDTLVDPHKNYQVANMISGNWSNLLAWGMNPDGSFNWSSYPDDWVAKYGAATEARTRDFFSKYSQINTHNYSEGAYRTHEGMAKIHEGEMILPANVAERFREIMREAGGPRSGGAGNVNITLNIERASDAEAERFARKVKKILEQDNWESSVRTR